MNCKLCLLFLLSTSILVSAEQPTSVPGKYAMTPQAFPPLDWVINREVQPYPVYGIYTWFGEYTQLREQIKKVGWSTLRIGGPKNDENMKMLFEDGHNFVCFTGSHTGVKVGKRDKYDSDEAYLEARRKDATSFLKRFGANGNFYKEFPQFADRHIPFIMIHNEPNFHYMWKAGSEAQREALYAKLAPMITDLVREHSPKSKVIGFTAGGAGAGDLRFVKNVLKIDPRCITEVDGFATHPYVDPVPPETHNIRKWGSYSIANSLNTLRKNFDEYKRKDILVWYTEAGWKIGKKDGGAYDEKPEKIVSLDLQAAYSCRYYALALRLGVSCVTNMFITDTDGFNGGFFDRLNDMKWRPSAYAVQNMIKTMPHPALQAAQSDGKDGNYIYEFTSHALKKNSPTVIMAYRVEDPAKVDIQVEWKKVEVIDMYGESQTVLADNGVINTEIGPLPIYLREAK